MVYLLTFLAICDIIEILGRFFVPKIFERGK